MARPDEVPQGWMEGKVFTLRVDCPHASEFTGHHGKDGAIMRPTPYRKGDKVKVVMVSRFGDCGITTNLKALRGYAARVNPHHLEPTEGLPEGICQKCHYETEAHIAGRCVEAVT